MELKHAFGVSARSELIWVEWKYVDAPRTYAIGNTLSTKYQVDVHLYEHDLTTWVLKIWKEKDMLSPFYHSIGHKTRKEAIEDAQWMMGIGNIPEWQVINVRERWQ